MTQQQPPLTRLVDTQETHDPASMRPIGDARLHWHAMDRSMVERQLDAGARGLTTHEAQARLALRGPNEIPEQPPPSSLVMLLRQLRSPLIYILLAALVVTVLLGEHVDAGVIAAVLVLNSVIGFSQERRAEGAVRALRQLVVPRARVVRDGQDREIESRELVAGDLAVLEPGTRVPADLRLISATALRIDESLLTGESEPVSKTAPAVEEDAVLSDRTCMAHTGTIVTSGRGSGLVVATGSDTELGAIAGLMRGEVETRTPLQRRMDRFARTIGFAVGVAALVAFASGLILGGTAHEMFLVAVALAVSAVPEGLPVAVTITLAVGVRRMAHRRAVVRRLAAVETLGSTTVIGSDKTGTLTENRMTVEEIWTVDRQFTLAGEVLDGAYMDGDEPASIDDDPVLHLTLLAGVFTNEADVHRRDDALVSTGDPTEVALLLAAMTAGIDPGSARAAHPLVADIPFEPSRQYSASVRNGHDGHRTYAKGAPERIVQMCSRMQTSRGPTALDAARVLDAARDLASRGLRVLALAYRPDAHPPVDPDAIAEDPHDLVLLGLQGMIDPPRPGVRESVSACQQAGMRVVMITGDHVDTATAIADQLGIRRPGDHVVTGADLRTMSGDDAARQVGRTSVFARVSPEDKLQIVRYLQARGDIVAVTGDGVNDAPALRAAEIGVAMGTSGTDVAREASDMVLADDNFVTIVAAVEEGRITFDNIRKVTFFLVSTGAAEIAAILTAVWLRWPLVFLPAQLLWLNLVTNGLQDVALAFEPAERGVLRRPPRRRVGGVLDRLMWERVALAGLVMGAGTLALFWWELVTTGSLVQAQTVALTTMVVFQVFQAGNSRSETDSILRRSPFSNKLLIASTAAALSIHVAALYVPATQFVLRVEPIEAAAWLRIIAVASTILVAMEAHKLLRRPSTHALNQRIEPPGSTTAGGT
jgi:calcium-translocating P-type ATPase